MSTVSVITPVHAAGTRYLQVPMAHCVARDDLAIEQGQKSMAIVVTAGQRGDLPQIEPVLEMVRVPRIGLGRPRVRPDCVRADRAYAARSNRAYLRRRGIRCTIPERPTKPANARSAAHAAADRRISNRSTTASVTRSSAGATEPRDTAPPCGTTNSQSATRRPY